MKQSITSSALSHPRRLCLAICVCATLLFSRPPQPAPSNINYDSAVTPEQVDAVLQSAASSALGGAEGTVIVMDPRNGRIRALVNPAMAFGQVYSPGSAIKPFTALAALQSGVINADSRLLCPGSYSSKDFKISCTHLPSGAPFGPAQALANSCNYYFAKLSERLDTATFDETLQEFGFGAVTNVNAQAEPPGELPHGHWQVASGLGETSHLLVTPVQMIIAYVALLNGGNLYHPQVAPPSSFSPELRAHIEIEPRQRSILLQGMRGAVTYGTAAGAGLEKMPVNILGKTGTSGAGDTVAMHGWFIGFASEGGGAPQPESIRLAVLVFLRRGSGAQSAQVARPVFASFARFANIVVDSAVVQLAHRDATRSSSLAETPGPPGNSSASPLALPHGSFEVRVHLARENRTGTVNFEDYVLGVLNAEGAVENEPEALKALAVCARTFALKNLNRHRRDDYDFCSTTHCQRYLSTESHPAFNLSLLREAVSATSGEVLVDERHELASAFYHAACGGMTADISTLWGGQAKSYLRGVRDDYCEAMPHRSWTDVIPVAKLASAMQADARSNTGGLLTGVEVLKRDASGRAALIALEGPRRRVLSGWDFKIIAGRSLGWNVLKSSRFEVARSGNDFIFHGSGFGHGLGVCQEGAHVMAQRGATYRQILSYYLPGTQMGHQGDEVPGGNGRVNSGTLQSSVDLWKRGNFREKVTAENRVWGVRSPSLFEVAPWKADLIPGPVRLGHHETRAYHSVAANWFGELERRDGSKRKSGVPTWIVSGLAAPLNRRLSLSGKHFRINYPAKLPQSEIRTAMEILEAARSGVGLRLNAASITPVKTGMLEVNFNETTGDFTARTGQPWWAAAATKGAIIELQPFEVLRRRGILATTLRHEYAHFVIDALSRGRAPRWLAEGLAMHFAGERPAVSDRQRLTRLSENELEARTNELERKISNPGSLEEMRALYAQAYHAVQLLIAKEGESAVWRSLSRGRIF